MGWLWSRLGWGLLALGVGVLVWALWWDRAGWRGRAVLRCRKCWYDLAGVGERATADAPVVCPECGKGHRSRRAMRRTRRRWKWVVCAAMVFVAAHAAWSAPGIQKRGWGAAVPGVVLVAWMPLMSEEPGTGLENMVGLFGPGSGLPAVSGMDRLVMKEIGDGWYWGGGAPPQRLGWVSRRLLFLLARMEDVAVITDGTTAKGQAYKNAVTLAVHGDAALASERRWANGVAHVEAVPDMAYGPGEVVRGDFRIRRLVVGGYTLSGNIGSISLEFRGFSPSSMRINGMMPGGTPQEMAEHWIERFLWDGVHEADRAQGRVYSEQKHPLGIADPDGTGGAAVRIYYAVMVNDAGPGEAERMVRVGTVERSIPVRIDEDRAMAVDQSSATRAMIERSLRAELTVEHNSTRKAWMPLVRLRWAGPRPDGETLLFGGMVAVTLVDTRSPAEHGRTMLESRHDQSWWLVDPSGPNERQRELAARPGENRHFAGEVKPNWLLASVPDPSGYRLMVRITPMQGNFTRTYGGLWADRVYDGVLVVPLDNWTLDEVRRYIVSGVVPDHAMP